MSSSIKEILIPIFAKIGVNNKWMIRFILQLFEAIIVRRGRFNFTNLARYSELHECTFRRRFAQGFDWTAFNLAIIGQYLCNRDRPLLGSMDCSYIRKSGTKTAGLDKFWSSTAKKPLLGLEISIIALIDVIDKAAWSVQVSQTPAGLSSKATVGYSRMDFYVEQLLRCLPKLQKIKYFVGDTAYANRKITEALFQHNRHLITQLRSDANLRYLEALPKPGKPGPKPKWGEKVAFTKLDRWHYLGRDFKHAHLDLYTQVLYSPHFDCLFRVVLVKHRRTGQYRLIASTHIEQDIRQIVAFYQSRFQIEFTIRDAKQFAGLEEAQCRSQEALDFHFNAAMSTVNLLSVLLKRIKPSLHSKNSLIRWAHNAKIIERLIQKLGLEPEFVNSMPKIKSLYHYGLMEANAC